MPNTYLKKVSGRAIHHDQDRKTRNKGRIHPIVDLKRKQMLADKVETIRVEVLSWLLIISVTTALIYFFSNLE